jgi:putative transposase
LDVKKRFSGEQIIGFLQEEDKGVAVKELCRKHGFSEAGYYLWRSKFGGMDVSDAKRLKAAAGTTRFSSESSTSKTLIRCCIRPSRRNVYRTGNTGSLSCASGLMKGLGCW